MLEIDCLEPNKYKALIIIGQVFQVAYTIFGTLLCGVLLGYFIDKFMNSLPIFTIIGSILGIVSSFMSLLKIGRTKK